MNQAQYTIPLDSIPTSLKDKLDSMQQLNHRDRCVLLRIMVEDVGLIRARATAVQRRMADAILRTWPYLGVGGDENFDSTHVWMERLRNLVRNISKRNYDPASIAQLTAAAAADDAQMAAERARVRRQRRQLFIDMNQLVAG